MDINEQIVRSWLETQGFLVKSRLKYKITNGKYTGWGDIDLIAFHLHSGNKVAVDISAWMTEYISLSYVKDPKSELFYRLLKSTLPEPREAIRKAFGVKYDNQYEIWLVVSFLAPTQREQVEAECRKHVDRIIEFPQIMRDLIDFVKENPNPTQETEALQTIRALVLCGLL